jgi:hypothetical protein
VKRVTPNAALPIVGSTTVAAAGAAWPAVFVAIAVVIAICLWGMFRSGSIADRARSDDDQTESGTD